jgi:hypothetical protein
MSRVSLACLLLVACSAPPDAGADAGRDIGPREDAGGDDAPTDAGGGRSGIDGERDRLLATYLAYLRSRPGFTQTNGLGSDLSSVCALWDTATPATRAVFLTITDRMDGSRLADGTSMLEHVETLYRVVGGEGESATDRGACGGDGNRMFVSIDAALRDALIAANVNRGARLPTGAYDVGDVVPSSFWRDSHDAAGPHAPFTMSDETDGGAPRGQIHFFEDPGSPAASAPLGRTDLMDLVDPDALEMDQDYDCVHASNPLCDYTFYGPACLPRTTLPGIDLYGASYRPVDTTWRPLGC